ncbi:uncharacterized protein LOC131892660 [Tigriopus californicus]|uniref:uncharacterized protein LOC131892660 n=1 Tax=Tigriopus californicus TaxID=6832 RepID=UPI0027DA8EA5|nr:uncharacterized protein LOC131892660 [Tigriopus californicus]
MKGLIIFGYFFISLICHVSPTTQCLFGDISQCQRVKDEAKGVCDCPCLPKCCPPQYVLISSDKKGHHGWECQYWDGDIPFGLPDVQFTGRLNNQSLNIKPRFFHSVFPSCKGFESDDWVFSVHNVENVHLNADYQSEYTLFINEFDGPENQTMHERKVISNNENAVDKTRHETLHRYHDAVVGSKPLMYFCFDTLIENDGPTIPEQSSKETKNRSVALTCPRVPFAENATIYKCCPMGQSFDSTMKCSENVHDSHNWHLPINGHLYHEKELVRLNVLKYNSEKTYAVHSAATRQCLSKESYKQFNDTDDFHIGPDGKLHFTDAHDTMPQLQEYCIDQYGKSVAPTNLRPSYEEVGDYGNYSYYDTAAYDYGDDYGDASEMDETAAMLHEMSNHDCHSKEDKPWNMDIMYCASTILQIRKCCPNDTILNLRSRACTNEQNSSWNMPPIYKRDLSILNANGASSKRLNLFPSAIFNMNTKNLFVTGTDDFKIMVDGTLRFQGKVYSSNQYCLDNSINYCERGVVATLRAIVDDEELNRQGAGAIFGTNKEDSETSLYIKRVGYPISIICLLITLVIFVVVPELRKDLYGKMVISIVTSQTIVFICLLVGTFPSVSVSRINGPCITQAILTYFFILCGFMWMGAMSYNIMTKFRANTILPKEADYQRFITYSAFCFGAPLLMATLVLALDRNIFNLDSDASNWRPGFGEESCWFTSCSNALTYFLYIPITGMLLTNVSFFTYAAVKLGGMQRRIREARPESKRGSDHENPNRRKFAKQVSILSNKSVGSKNKAKLKANRDRLITYLKLFVAMGLTWVFEILAWVLSEKSVQAPQPIIICLNMVNICQGIVMFHVFALKDTTRQKISDIFSSRGHRFTGFRPGDNDHRVNSVSRNTRSSSSLTHQTSCSFDKSSDDGMDLPLQVSSNPNPGGGSFQDQDLTMVDLSD